MFLGHLFSKSMLGDLSVSGKILGKRGRGGQRNIFLDNFEEINGALRNRSASMPFLIECLLYMHLNQRNGYFILFSQ